MECPLYQNERYCLFRNLRETNKKIETLLFENSNIFDKVRAYIRQTKRFLSVVGHLVYINLFPMFHYIVLNIIYICVCAIFVDIIIYVLFVWRGQSINCDNFLSNPIAVLFAIK